MLNQRLELEKVEAFPDGKLNVYRIKIIEEDGKELARVPEIEKINPGDRLPSEGLVRAVAHALWGATDVMKSVLPLTSKKGRLYRSRGKDTTPTPALAGPISAVKDVQLADPRASVIKHRGAEQTSYEPQYAGTPQGFVSRQPERKIKHRGRDQH